VNGFTIEVQGPYMCTWNTSQRRRGAARSVVSHAFFMTISRRGNGGTWTPVSIRRSCMRRRPEPSAPNTDREL